MEIWDLIGELVECVSSLNVFKRAIECKFMKLHPPNKLPFMSEICTNMYLNCPCKEKGVNHSHIPMQSIWVQQIVQTMEFCVCSSENVSIIQGNL